MLTEMSLFCLGAHAVAANWCHYPVNSSKHNVTFDSAPLAPLCENIMSFTKLEILLKEDDQATATGKTYGKFC